MKDLISAVQNLLANKQQTFKDIGGRRKTIQDDNGEMMWISSFDDMIEVEAALRDVLSKATS